jgi:hypothetical protein
MIVSLPLNTFIARVLKNMQGKQMKNRGKAVPFFHSLGSCATFFLSGNAVVMVDSSCALTQSGGSA